METQSEIASLGAANVEENSWNALSAWFSVLMPKRDFAIRFYAYFLRHLSVFANEVCEWPDWENQQREVRQPPGEFEVADERPIANGHSASDRSQHQRNG